MRVCLRCCWKQRPRLAKVADAPWALETFGGKADGWTSELGLSKIWDSRNSQDTPSSWLQNHFAQMSGSCEQEGRWAPGLSPIAPGGGPACEDLPGDGTEVAFLAGTQGQ